MPHHHAAGIHQHHHKRQEEQTVVQYVYETAAKTFDGPVGGYMTLNPPPAPSPTPQAQSSNSDSSDSNSNNDSSDQQQSGNSKQQQQEQQQAAAASSAAAQSAAAESAAAESSASADAAAAAAASSSSEAAEQAQSTPTPTPSPKKQQSSAAAASASSEAPTSTPESHSSKKAASKTPTAPTSASAAATSEVTTPTLESSASLPSTAASSASSSAAPDHSSGGLSPGGKAGLAIGVLLIIGLLAGLAFFLIRRKQRRASEGTYEQTDDEKSAFAAGLARQQSTASTKTTATAPRLSLRPVTQFLPDLAARGKAANAVAGAGLHDSSIASAAAMAKNHENEKANPFGDHAEAGQRKRLSDRSDGIPIQNNSPENPFGNHAEAAPPTNGADQAPTQNGDMPAPLRVRTPTPEGPAAGVAAAAIAGVKQKQNAPKALNLSSNRSVSPPATSPAASDFSQTPASPGAMVNGQPPSNVHRVQLDFKPSMDDELALRAGDLVRLLHEYDDGWALCIRLDRSQQGVAPRTCLSARPVKPRPRGPPRGPGPRGPPPGMMGPGPQRPASPASGRGSPGPYGPGPNGRSPRPMGPGPRGQPRSMSPGPYGGGPRQPQGPPPGSKRRSNSASEFRDRRQSPPGPSPMNPNMQRVPLQQQAVAPLSPSSSITTPRKPVPGQAM